LLANQLKLQALSTSLFVGVIVQRLIVTDPIWVRAFDDS